VLLEILDLGLADVCLEIARREAMDDDATQVRRKLAQARRYLDAIQVE
jgi:hypothetical protein